MKNNKNRGLKNIGLVLIAIVLFPVLFYSVNEFNSMSDTEEMIAAIYSRQMDALLFSVNQHTWDYINFQTVKVQKFLNDPQKDNSDFFSSTNPVLMLSVFSMNYKQTASYGNEEFHHYEAGAGNVRNRERGGLA